MKHDLHLKCNNDSDSLDYLLVYPHDGNIFFETENKYSGYMDFTVISLDKEKATRLRDFLTELIDNLE